MCVFAFGLRPELAALQFHTAHVPSTEAGERGGVDSGKRREREGEAVREESG